MALKSSLKANAPSLLSDITPCHYVKTYGRIKILKGFHKLNYYMTMTWNIFHKAKTALTLSNCSLIMQLTHSPCWFWCIPWELLFSRGFGLSLLPQDQTVVIARWRLQRTLTQALLWPLAHWVRPEVSLQRYQSLWDFSNNFSPPPKWWKQLKGTVPIQPLIFPGQDNIPLTAEQRQRASTDKTLFWKRLCKTKSEAKSRVKQPSGVWLPGSTWGNHISSCLPLGCRQLCR